MSSTLQCFVDELRPSVVFLLFQLASITTAAFAAANKNLSVDVQCARKCDYSLL